MPTTPLPPPPVLRRHGALHTTPGVRHRRPLIRVRALGLGFVVVVIAVLFGWLLASGAHAAPDAPLP